MADSQQRKGTVPGGICNLLNTVLGGGISLISLPLATYKAGVIWMPTFELISAIATSYTCYLLVVAADRLSCESYADLGLRCFGRAAVVVPILICLNNFGVCVAFVEVFADVVPPLVSSAGVHIFILSREVLIAMLIIVLAIPVLIVRSINGFVVPSLIATVISATFVIYGIVSGASSIAPKGNHHPISDQLVAGIDGGAPSVSNMLSACAIISLSWTCHFNVLPIFITLQNRTTQQMRTIIVFSMGLAGSVYVLFGLFAYFCFLSDTTGDTLADFSQKSVGQVLRVFVVGSLCLSFPLFALEAAHNLDNLIFAQYHTQQQRFEGLRSSFLQQSFYESFPGSLDHDTGEVSSWSDDGSSPPFIAEDAPAPHCLSDKPSESKTSWADDERLRLRLEGGAFTFLVGVMAVVFKDTSTVIGFVGAACGIPIMYILPPLLFILSLSKNGEEGETSGNQSRDRPLPEQQKRRTSLSTYMIPSCVLAVGICLCLSCIISLIIDAI